MRVGSWNLNHRGRAATREQGALVRDRGVELLLVQEANPASLDVLVEAAGLDWVVTPTGIWPGEPTVGRQPLAAIAGRGSRPEEVGHLPGPASPLRMVYATVEAGAGSFTVASYCAPHGSGFGYGRVEHALALLEWVNAVQGPLILGADAHAPKVDHPDPDLVRTYCHTGDRRLHGARGDDVMFGGRPEHQLSDAYRRWLHQNPGLLQATAVAQPVGPLAVSHYEPVRLHRDRAARRFDAIWVSREFDVAHVTYDYDAAVAAGSDHALVTADVTCDTSVL
ncbi:hypothetical protein [Tessaracoccus oleiagri]|uniref:Exonuclease III n=1 Tax=Tessaracoccus oleiagri TaxID=686624 RepID=A0A1G9HP58_9ACTN|nr:hypothetical protein [Tessaracoccus oleiagri]SDL14645.1 hypothetical protein SAMN04488242_0435 [Tessaracoccus oleiagri]